MSRLKPEFEELLRLQPDSAFLRDLSSLQLKRLAEPASMKVFPARTLLYRQGDKPTVCVLVVNGMIKLSEVSDTGHLTTLTLISRGQMVGGQALVGHDTNLFSAEAVDSTRALVWRGPELRALMQRIPRLAWNAYVATYGRLEEFAARWRELVTDNVEQRIARALLRLARQLAKREGEQLIIDSRISGQDLAGYIGTSLFTVSRVLNRWERQGMIRHRRNILILQDIHALNTIAGLGWTEDLLPAVSNG